MKYNLLDEKWIPVLYRDGKYKRVGIRKALGFLMAVVVWRRWGPTLIHRAAGCQVPKLHSLLKGAIDV